MDSSVFITANEISDQGLVRPVSGRRMAAVSGSNPANEVTRAEPETPESGATNDPEDVLAFYSKLTPEIKEKFPELPLPVDPGKPISLSCKFMPGESRRYQITARTDLNTMGVISQQQQDERIRCTCDAVSDAGFLVGVEYEASVAQMETPGGSYLIDMENPERDRAAPAFRPIMGVMKASHSARSVYTVDQLGVINEFTPPQAMIEAIKASPQAQSMSISAESLSENFVAMWISMPDHPVKVGDQWEGMDTVSVFKPGETKVTETFLGIATGNGREWAVIRLETSSSGRPYTAEIFGGMTATSDSIVYFDMEAGCADRIFTSSVSKMNLNINNTSLEQLIDGKSEIRRLDDTPK